LERLPININLFFANKKTHHHLNCKHDRIV